MIKPLVLFTVLAASGLVACSQGSSPPPQPSITVGFGDESIAARLGAPVIEVKAAHPQALVSAELVGPAGNVVAAAPGQLEPQIPAGYPWGPSVGFGVFGGRGSGGSVSGGGVGIGVPIGGDYYGSATVPEGSLVRSRALVLVQNMDDYRRQWERSTVRLKFGNAAGDNTTAEIPAPSPGGR
jgi:hypothetical protein